jgi:hypothetical protein
VPTRVDSLPTSDSRSRNLRPTLALRLSTSLQRGRLNNLLADGADPSASGELELRAHLLCSPGSRERLARGLERIMRQASESAPRRRPLARVHRTAVKECAQDLEALVRRLRDGKPVDPRGVALTRRLLTDGTSPLYHRAVQPLRYEIRSARFALDPVGLDASGLATAA